MSTGAWGLMASEIPSWSRLSAIVKATGLFSAGCIRPATKGGRLPGAKRLIKFQSGGG